LSTVPVPGSDTGTDKKKCSGIGMYVISVVVKVPVCIIGTV
jgi:hypothetical protein